MCLKIYLVRNPNVVYFCKMTKRNILIFGSVALLLVAAGKLGRNLFSASRLSFRIKKVNVELRGLSPYLIVDIGVSNPTDTPFSFSALTGKAFAGGSYIADVSYFGNNVISPMSETVVALPIRLQNLTGAVNNLISMVTLKSGVNTDIRLQGTVNIDSVPVPFDLQYKLI